MPMYAHALTQTCRTHLRMHAQLCMQSSSAERRCTLSRTRGVAPGSASQVVLFTTASCLLLLFERRCYDFTAALLATLLATLLALELFLAMPHRQASWKRWFTRLAY